MLKRTLMLSALLALVMTMACATTGTDCGDCNAIADKDATISALQSENGQLQTQLQNCKADLEVRDRKIEALEKTIAELQAELANCKGAHWAIKNDADVLFKSGSAILSEGGKKVLDEAAQMIVEKHADMDITVEGHTDTDPIRSSNWKDNFDLGAARAMSVMRYLIGKGVAADKCSAITFGEYQPLGDEKSKNRRAVIVINSGWPRF